MYYDKETTIGPKLRIGDKVRVIKAIRNFDKSYLSNGTEEIFTVPELLRTVPVSYKLKDYGDKELLCSFYRNNYEKYLT